MTSRDSSLETQKSTEKILKIQELSKNKNPDKISHISVDCRDLCSLAALILLFSSFFFFPFGKN